MDADLEDFVGVLEKWPCFHGSLRNRLGKLAKWKALRKGTADAERLAELRRCYGLATHDLEEAVTPLARTCHSILCILKLVQEFDQWRSSKSTHVKPGCRKLTTQINIAGNKYLHDDFAFGTRDGLIPAVQRISDAREIHKAGLNKPFARIHFDFAVTQEAAGAPTTIVTREHAEAA